MTIEVARRTVLGGVAAAALAPLIARARPLASTAAPLGMTWPADQALPRFAVPEQLDTADIRALTGDQQLLLVTLQGIVNRSQPRLYFFMAGDGTDQTWLDTIGVPNTIAADPLGLIGKYAAEAAGAVLYDPALPDTVNIATSLAGILGGVVATADLASQYNFPVLMDLRGRFAGKLDAYSWLIANYWPLLTQRLLTAIDPASPNLRDYIVATQALVFWLDPTVAAEAALFAQILQKVAPDTPYMGWFVNGDEAAGVTLCSQNGVPVVAADFLNNATVFGGVAAPIRAGQPVVPVPPLFKYKAYVTLTMSDGDNLQFDQHRLRTIWDDPARGTVPLNWSISPLLLDAAPIMLSYYQATQTMNDFLVAGPSGAGYTYPGDWPAGALPSFTTRTGAYMARAGLNVAYTLNRLGLTNLDFTDAVAQAYLQDVRLLGVLGNWTARSGISTQAGLPVVTQIGVFSVTDAQLALAGATKGWTGTSPLFVAIGIDAWAMAPSDIATLAASLGPHFEIVRADVFFKLLRQTLCYGTRRPGAGESPCGIVQGPGGIRR
jgi:hypothetical protein